MASPPAVHSQLPESNSRDETADDGAVAEEREGVRTLTIIVGGILGGAVAAAMLANVIVANLSLS